MKVLNIQIDVSSLDKEELSDLQLDIEDMIADYDTSTILVNAVREIEVDEDDDNTTRH
jgi:hypothetical protein